MFSDEEKRNIIDCYISGKSANETAKFFNITEGSVRYILKKHNIPSRSVGEGNSLKWENTDFRNNQIYKRTGNPSGALGKQWKLNHIKKSPNTKGEKNHFWKGGKTKLSAQIKNSAEYSFWRMEIFRRDCFICQHCGAKNKVGERYIFDADHIYPFSKIIDDFKIKSIEEAISCKELWDINNGRCLCRDCHKKTDTWGVNLNKNVEKF